MKKTNNTPNYNKAYDAYEFSLNQTRDEFEGTDFRETTIVQLGHLLNREGTVRFEGGKVAIRWTIHFDDGTEKQFVIRVDVYDFARECDAKVDGGIIYNGGYETFFGLVRKSGNPFNGFASKEEYERNLDYARKYFSKEYEGSDTFAVYAKGDQMEIVWSCSRTLQKI